MMANHSNSTTTLRVAQVAFNLGQYVLGARAGGMGVWVAGCSLNKCLGCTSAHTWDQTSGSVLTVAQLIGVACGQSQPPSRLMVSGGEPTDQADAVMALVRAFSREFPNAETVLYTGLRWSAMTRRFAALADAVDVVIAGPYVQSLPATPLAGSANQTVHLLTARAAERYGDWLQWPMHAVQVAAGRGHDLVTVGIPKRGAMQRAAAALPVAAASWSHVELQSQRKTRSTA